MASDTYQGLQDERLATMKSMDRYRFFRSAILERDAHTCQLCDKPLEMKDLDIDHIIPVAEGGPTTWVNLRATHRYCNRKRGALLAASRRIRVIREFHRFVLRIPPGLHSEIVAWSEEENRSLTGQIIYLLSQAVKNRKPG